MKPLFCFRGFKYFALGNWYGIRQGPMWEMDGVKIFMIDIGGISVGLRWTNAPLVLLKFRQIVLALVWWLVPRICTEALYKLAKYKIVRHIGRDIIVYDIVRD